MSEPHSHLARHVSQTTLDLARLEAFLAEPRMLAPVTGLSDTEQAEAPAPGEVPTPDDQPDDPLDPRGPRDPRDQRGDPKNPRGRR